MKQTILKKIKARDRDGLNGEITYGIHYIDGNSDAHFTVTAWFGSGRTEYGGACHEVILELAPQLKPFVDLHLSDTDGAPMHAVANAKYHAGFGKWSEYDLDKLASHLRIDWSDAQFITSLPENEFEQFIEAQRPRWKEEASKALAMLK